MVHKDNNPFDQRTKKIDEKNKGFGTKARSLKFNYSKFLLITPMPSTQTPLSN